MSGLTRGLRYSIDVLLAVALFFLSQAVYRHSSGAIQLCDSTYSLVLGERLLRTGSVDLAAVVPADPALRAAMQGYQPALDRPYHFVARTDAASGAAHIYYGYPIGATLLSLPWIKRDIIDKNATLLDASGYPDPLAEGQAQVRIATRVCAAIAVLFYVLARLFCGRPASVGIALGFAFASPLWSTLSRSLWSHTWMVFWLTLAVLLLVLARRTRASGLVGPVLGAGLGTALFWVGLCRPQGLLSAGAIGIFLLLFERRLLLPVIVAGAAWSAALLVTSHQMFGSWLPPSIYFPGMFSIDGSLQRAFWVLFSPSRGLLIFCPYLLVVGGALIATRHNVGDRALLLPIVVAMTLTLVLFSLFKDWSAGYSYGPRYLSDMLPWFVLASALAADAFARSKRGAARIALTVLLGVGVAWGAFVHGRGANAQSAWDWNDLARTVGLDAAAKDWRHPQFLAGITFRVDDKGRLIDK